MFTTFIPREWDFNILSLSLCNETLQRVSQMYINVNENTPKMINDILAVNK